MRIKKKNNEMNSIENGHQNKSLRITFQGRLPERVVIGHISYLVQQYIIPIPKCYKCQIYGHGTMACKNKQGCSKCSEFNDTFKSAIINLTVFTARKIMPQEI